MKTKIFPKLRSSSRSKLLMKSDVEADSNTYTEMQRAKKEGEPTLSDPRAMGMFYQATLIKTAQE